MEQCARQVIRGGTNSPRPPLHLAPVLTVFVVPPPSMGDLDGGVQESVRIRAVQAKHVTTTVCS